MRILMCTNGSEHAERALRFGALIARAAQGPVTLLGVVEARREKARIRQALERGLALLSPQVPEVETKVRYGHAVEEILAEIETGNYDLVVTGSRGLRGITRFLLGSTTFRLVQHATIPVLVVKKDRAQLAKILVCTGGGKGGEEDTRVGGRIAALTGAQVTVLHVMSQLPLAPTAKLADLEASVEEAMRHETREGVHLKKNLRILEKLGVKGQARIRRGLVLNEILAEIRERDYDLIVIGAYAAEGWYSVLMPDIANQILSHAQRPVLVVQARVGQ